MKSTVIFLVGIAVIGAFLAFYPANAITLTGEECPEGWAFRLYHCYYFSNDTADWFSAWQKCNKLQADLVSIESETEFQNIIGQIKQRAAGKFRWWTSGSDLHQTSDWAWYGTKNKVYYQNFCSPEDIGIGRCLTLDAACGYQFVTESCEETVIRYICERDAHL